MRRYRFLLPVLILGFCILFSAACQVQPSQFTAKADPHESIEQITETFDATCNDIFSEDERRSMETAAQTTSPTASAKSPAAVIDADPSDRTVKAVTSSEEDPIKDTTEKSTRQPDSTKTSQSEQEPIKTTKSTATTAKKTTIPETALESTFIEETTVTAETKPSPKPTTTPTPAPGSEPPLSDEKMAKEIFKYLSQYRVENGLPEFKEGEPRMWEAAQIRAGEIIILFDHWRPNNRSWNDVLWEVGINDSYSEMTECLSHCAPWDDAKFIAYYFDRSPNHKYYILHEMHTTAAVGYVNRGDEGQFTALIMTDDKK